MYVHMYISHRSIYTQICMLELKLGEASWPETRECARMLLPQFWASVLFRQLGSGIRATGVNIFTVQQLRYIPSDPARAD